MRLDCSRAEANIQSIESIVQREAAVLRLGIGTFQLLEDEFVCFGAMIAPKISPSRRA